MANESCLKRILAWTGLLCCVLAFYRVFFLPNTWGDVSSIGQRPVLERFLRKARAVENADCLTVLTAEERVKTLTTPNYPNDYPSNTYCQWLLTTIDPNDTISIEIDALFIEPETLCRRDSLQVHLGFTPEAPFLGPFCGYMNDKIIETNSSTLLLIFHSDDAFEDKGFSIHYFLHSVRGCKEWVTEASGTLTSPRYPDPYPDDTDCSTLIRVGENKKIVLHFNVVDLEEGENCTFDFIQVFDGRNSSSPLLGHICRQSDELSFESSSNFLLVHFHSDSSVSKKGYRATYSSFDKRSRFNGECHWESHENNGTITSPDYPKHYPSFANCSIGILAPDSESRVLVTFDSVLLETDSNCSYDFLQIKEDNHVVGRYCGRRTEPKQWLSQGNEILVEFRSDSTLEFTGFKLQYEFIRAASNTETAEEEEEDWFSFTTKPQNATLTAGSSYMLHCDTEHPNARIRWLKEDTFLAEASLPKGIQLLANNTLWITNMQRDLVGEYTCVAVSPEEDIVATASITMKDDLNNCEIKFRITPSDLKLKEGDYAYLECRAASLDVKLSWEKDGQPLQQGQHVTVLKNGYIFVDRVALEDAGLYSCVAHDRTSGCLQRKSATLTVTEEIRLEEICGRPKFGESALEKFPNGLGKIIGGNNAQKGAYPWQVMLWESGRGLFCGGTLLNERWVVTAAHCLINNKHNISWEKIIVKLGKYDTEMNELQEIHTTVADSSAIVKHPRFTKMTFDNDLALIRLRDRVHFTDYVLPICLGDRELSERLLAGDGDGSGPRMGTVIGWGKLKENGPSPRFLQEIQLPLVDPEVCKKSTDYLVTRNMFCAGYSQEVIGDSCHGDSGGPFMRRYNKKWYLLGIVSWGEGCGQKNKYGFYTRIPNHLSWIEGIIQS